MKALSRIGIASAMALCIAGCAAPGPPIVPTATVSPSRTKEIPADRARNAIAIGKSTRAEVIAALGETLAISFESGFEVWIYRLAQEQKGARAGSEKRAGPGATGEFVVLFAPSGVVAKTRIRPAPAMKDAG